MAERCLDMTVAYVKERHQFARPVGSFQALKHRLADVWIAVTQARAAARYAAACLAEGDPDVSVAVALAKAACGEAAVHAAQECVQLHGGIGFTWEHPAHLLLKRAKSGSIAFGTPDRHRAALARLASLPPPAAVTPNAGLGGLRKELECSRSRARVWWSPGAGSGIGAALARRFAAEGARVVVNDIDAAAAAAVAGVLRGHRHAR